LIIGADWKEKRIARALDQWVKKMKCSGQYGLGIESFKEIKVGVVDSNVEDGCESFDPFTDNDTRLLDMKGLYGYFTVALKNGATVDGFFKDGLRHGHCKIVSSRTNVEKIAGEYRMGKLCGKAKVTFYDKKNDYWLF
jgi:hypothetical protein